MSRMRIRTEEEGRRRRKRMTGRRRTVENDNEEDRSNFYFAERYDTHNCTYRIHITL